MGTVVTAVDTEDRVVGTEQDQVAATVAVQGADTEVVPAAVTTEGRVAATRVVPAAVPVAEVDAAHPARHLTPRAAAPHLAGLTKQWSVGLEESQPHSGTRSRPPIPNSFRLNPAGLDAPSLMMLYFFAYQLKIHIRKSCKWMGP